MTDEEKIELGLRAATTFKELFPGPWKHDVYPGSEKYECDRCNKTWPFKGNDPCILSERKCTVPDPIDINDWNVAMTLRDEMCNSLAWDRACYDVWQRVTDKAVTYATFWRNYAKPKHYIEAACIEKERE